MLESFLAVLKEHGYAAFVGTLLISGLGVPLPEDIPLLVGGYLASPAVGTLNLWLTIVLAMVSILGADCFFFFFGRRLRRKGNGEMPRFIQRLLTPERQKRVEAYFQKHGKWTTFFGRFLPGLRSPIFFCAGLWGVPTSTFLFSDGLAAILSVPALVVVGYVFGNNLQEIQGIVGRVEYAIIGAIVLLVVVSVIVGQVRKRREAQIIAEAAARAKQEEEESRAAKG